MADATAARRAMAVLRTLASAPGPLPAAVIAREVGIPRSSTYHLLTAMAEDGFVVHDPDDRRWGLGVTAFELGSAYLRQDPLQRRAGPVLRGLVRELPSDLAAMAHCSVLHGRESLYISVQPTSRLVTIVAEVGVRLPASLTASGRSMLAALPSSQVRALFPNADAFIDRTGRGPMSPSALARLLASERPTGLSVEEGMVTDGYSSIASASVDRSGRPLAAIGLTVHQDHLAPDQVGHFAELLRRACEALTRALGVQH